MKIDGFDGNFLEGDQKNNKASAKSVGSMPFSQQDDPMSMLMSSFFDAVFSVDESSDDMTTRITFTSKTEQPTEKEDLADQILRGVKSMDNKTLKLTAKVITEELKRRGLI